MKKVLSLALIIAILVLSLASCGLKILGKWVYSLSVLGQEVKVTLNFKANGELETTTETTILGSTSSETDTCKYSFDGKTLIIDGEETDYTLENNVLKIAIGEFGTVDFVKQ